MIAVKEQEDAYLAAYSELERRLAPKDPAWLKHVRRAAMHRFAELGFPTTRDEDWKYTSVAAIAKTTFRPAPKVPVSGEVAQKLQASPLACADCAKLETFVQ